MEQIYDIRTSKEFSGMTFSGYKKTDVKKQLVLTLTNSQLDESCYWSAELVCAGHFVDLWDIFIFFFSKNIHIGNPKIAIYLDKRLDVFKEIINEWKRPEIELRNNESIRDIISEIVVVLCDSTRSHVHCEISIKKDDFNLSVNTDRFKAPSVEYTTIFKHHDPDEIFVAVNELSFNLIDMNQQNSWYWIEWLMEYEIVYNKNRKKFQCEQRPEAPVQQKFQKDMVWLIWDVLIQRSTDFSQTIQSVILSCVHLYALKYVSSGAQFKKRKYLLYFAAELLTSQITLRNEIISDKSKLKHVSDNINNIYVQIHQNAETNEDE
jgi:hypothetical protein